jgi:hypothetical protein
MAVHKIIAAFDHGFEWCSDFLFQSVVYDVLELLSCLDLLIQNPKCYILKECDDNFFVVKDSLLIDNINQEFISFSSITSLWLDKVAQVIFE